MKRRINEILRSFYSIRVMIRKKMKIEHIAVWVADLEKIRVFYETYFGAISNEKYTNEKKGFSSYFLTFSSGARVELMSRVGIKDSIGEHLGWAHLAFSVGSQQVVDELTEKLRVAGHTIVGAPRTTGDGYYESVIEDPEGNLIELTI